MGRNNPREGLLLANQLTDEQETLLANMIEQARDRARAAWKSSDTEAFDRGFEAALHFSIEIDARRERTTPLSSSLKTMLSCLPPRPLSSGGNWVA